MLRKAIDCITQTQFNFKLKINCLEYLIHFLQFYFEPRVFMNLMTTDEQNMVITLITDNKFKNI